LEIDFPLRQRRWTVLVRLFLLIPQMIVVAVLGVGAGVTGVIGWFAALVTGRLPEWAEGFLRGYLAWYTRLAAYALLLTDQYPPFAFTAPDYPVRVAFAPAAPLNPVAVLFRLILAIPAAFVVTFVLYGWELFGFFAWLTVLFVGRTPPALFHATAAVVRYNLRYQTYLFMLTPGYPNRLFGDQPGPAGAEPARSHPDTTPHSTATPPTTAGTRPLYITGGAKVLLIVFIILGVLGFAGRIISNTVLTANHQLPTTSYTTDH
jgi:hypothetical protein